MKALIEFIRTHFSFEEKLMHDHGYAEAVSHQAQHLKLAETLASYDLQLKSNHQLNLRQLVDSLHDWLMDHILKSDRKLGEFLRQREA